jgi:cell division protein FtsQ
MPAVLAEERRAPARPRAKVNREFARSGGAQKAPAGVSKLRAGQAVGMPPRLALAACLLVLLMVAVAVLATGRRGEFLARSARSAFETQFASLGFRVGVIHLQGATPQAQAEILAAAGLKTGAPILTLDLAAVRARVERVGWVEHARVIRLFPDTVVIAVDQRPLVAVWEHAGRTVVIAADGTVVTKVDPGSFPVLPLVVGDGANVATSGILPLIQARPRLRERLDALVRVDSRRWNLRLKDGGLILLPATDEAGALARLDQLDQTSRILDLGFARIDLRDPEMMIVRPREAAKALAEGGV